MSNHTCNSDQRGFTLVELSIVLVIIGLIVAGILAGQDLIRAAEVRATVSQIEKYTTAMNTFRTKYNYLPGDIVESKVDAWGLTDSGDFEGDGDGVFEGDDGNGDGELTMVWAHLSDASLIDGTFDGAQAAVATTAAASTWPASKAGTNYIAVTSVSAVNYYYIGVTAQSSGGALTVADGLTVAEAYGIDNKLDDGMPTTGDITAMTALATVATNSDNCVSSTNNEYDMTVTAIACMLRTKAGI